MTYACRTCDTTFTAPTDTETVRCLGCGDMAERQPAVSSPPPDQTLRDRIAEPVCVCGHPMRQHHEDVCLTECGCNDGHEPETAADLPDRLEAALTARFTELGNPFSRMRIPFQGPDGWPASKEVGPHDVALVLRELLAAAPVVLPPAAARAAVLNAAAQRLYTALFPAVYDDMGQKAAEGVNRAVSELRRLAAEAPQPDDVERRVYAWAQTIDTIDGGRTVRIPGVHHTGSGPEATAIVVSREDVPVLAAMLTEAQPPEPDDTDLTETDIDRMTAAGIPVQIVTAPPATRGAEAPQPDTAPTVGYSGKGRVWCLACPYSADEDAPVTVNEVDPWELCPSCGRNIVDVARAKAASAAAGPGRAADTQDDEEADRG